MTGQRRRSVTRSRWFQHAPASEAALPTASNKVLVDCFHEYRRCFDCAALLRRHAAHCLAMLTAGKLATQVARLVGVMDERKVFGNSGARFMKELLAEADSRSKKLSARTGGPVQSNGSAAAPAGVCRAICFAPKQRGTSCRWSVLRHRQPRKSRQHRVACTQSLSYYT